MAGKLAHLGYKRVRAADGYRWYRDGKRVAQATVDRATRAVDAAARRREREREPEPAPVRRRVREREPEPAPAPARRGRPTRPLGDVGMSEAARMHLYAEALRIRADESVGQERRSLLARAAKAEASEQRALDGAASADTRDVTLDSKIHVRGAVVKWRDAAGRFARGRTAGGRKEVFYTTARGQLGAGIKRLISALLDFERADMTWDQAGDQYYRRAVALALI